MSQRIHPTVAEVTERITERSNAGRQAYLTRIRAAAEDGPARGQLGCANLAHGFAAAEPSEKPHYRAHSKPNLAIVTSYNDMLSAHQPFRDYPPELKDAVMRAGGLA
ncbi:MAG: phosphogluconate dehydratase, partial [Actinomycetia bacterium]|nr:phosphogluconate dehydratase [Actinomycetes bacterium]